MRTKYCVKDIKEVEYLTVHKKRQINFSCYDVETKLVVELNV